MSRGRKLKPGYTGYVKRTSLSDDFRSLVVPKPILPVPRPVPGDNCPVCLKEFVDPRILPCYHTFCRRCLQYAIDKALPDPDQDRGFTCILCGFFVKALDYSIPRTEWAEQIPARTTPKEDVKDGNDSDDTDSFSHIIGQKERDITKEWILEWQLSAYSKSNFNQRGLDPYERTKKGFRYVRNLKVTDEEADTGNDGRPENVNTGSDDGPERKSVEGVSGSGCDIIKDDVHGEPLGDSKITAITHYNDEIIIYDQGLSEVLIYNPDLTIKTALAFRPVFGLAILDDVLYMTNPHDLCINVIDLKTMKAKPDINITMKCYGITSLGEELAVLLWDVDDRDLHICFLDDCCVTGGYIPLMSGELKFKTPRKLAGCPRTRLLYVSDSESGIVKCFRPDGNLKWERIVYDAGEITVFNCYPIVARRFTHSIDVLTERGEFVGRLQSEDYGLISPNVLSANTDKSKLVISDHDHMIHTFKIKTKPREKVQDKNAAKSTSQQNDSCKCSIL